jgi:hypothetical protein
MSVENNKVIDYITEKEDAKVVLTISDHLEWDKDNEHLVVLQEKINSYLMAIESGQIYDKYPSSKGKQFVVSITLKYDPNENGKLFLSRVKSILSEAGYGFEFYRFDSAE